MKKILQMYWKMGDIAHQIDVLEDKVRYGKYNIKVIGGAILTTEEDMRYMVELQWDRIRALEDAISKTEESTKSYVQDLRDSMCKECNMNDNNPCQKDYVKMTLYKTLKEVII